MGREIRKNKVEVSPERKKNIKKIRKRERERLRQKLTLL